MSTDPKPRTAHVAEDHLKRLLTETYNEGMRDGMMLAADMAEKLAQLAENRVPESVGIELELDRERVYVLRQVASLIRAVKANSLKRPD